MYTVVGQQFRSGKHAWGLLIAWYEAIWLTRWHSYYGMPTLTDCDNPGEIISRTIPALGTLHLQQIGHGLRSRRHFTVRKSHWGYQIFFDHLIPRMWFPKPIRWHFYLETQKSPLFILWNTTLHYDSDHRSHSNQLILAVHSSKINSC